MNATGALDVDMSNSGKALRSVSSSLARWFWETHSVTIRSEKPFVFASELLSPIYTDCRRLLSYPQAIREIVDAAVEFLERSRLLDSFSVIAGGETAGIPYAAILAYRLGLPMVYVRKQPKHYGTLSRIEGVLEEGSRVLLFEDLVSDGGSKLSFVSALRDAHCDISYCLVLFEYGLPDCRRVLKTAGIELISLVDCNAILDYGIKDGRVGPEAARAVESFLLKPQKKQT